MLTDAQITTLRALVDSNEQLRLLVRGANGVAADDHAAAAMASTLLPNEVFEGRELSEKGIVKYYASGDSEAGHQALLALEAAAEADPNGLLARMIKWIYPDAKSGLDFGDPKLRDALAAYATAGVLTTTQRDTLLALGERAVTVDPSDIARVR
jgi:hypothetical protein